MDRVEMFLRDLAGISEKHGIVISGENFDKPFLDDATTSKELASDLDYDWETKKYSAGRRM